MRRQSAGLRFQFDESPESGVGSHKGSLESGVESLELEETERCRMCRGTGIRREQRMPDEAIAEMGTFCLCEAGREKWEGVLHTVKLDC
jgi:hypothetical protein